MAKAANWTEEDINILKTEYPKMGRCKELMELFPSRTIEGICLKANRIGLKVINNTKIRRTNEEYLELLKSTNFTSLEEYKGSTVPILHRCNICTHEWLTRPQHVLTVGARCPKCDLINRTNNIEYVDSILDNANMLRHSEYLGALKPIILEHMSCGYTWSTVFSYIQQGSGCPLCNKGFGYSYNKDNMPSVATLYLLEINTLGESFLKVGVTLRTPAKRVREIYSRLKGEAVSIKVLAEIKDSGINVLKREKEILTKYTGYHSSIVFDGDTELLSTQDLEEIIKEFK